MPKLTITQVLADRWWILFLSLGVALVMTPVARALAYRFRIVDKPDDLLKPHGRPVAYLGGLGMLCGLLAGLVTFIVILPNVGQRWNDIGQAFASLQPGKLLTNPLWKAMAAIVACIVITLVGLLDDLYNLKPRQKVYGQLLAAGILLIGGLADKMSIIVLAPIFAYVGGDVPYWLVLLVSVPASVLIVVAACNATNLLDGLDGLCGGVTAIITLGFLALAVWLAMWQTSNLPNTDALRVTLCLAMAGGVLGFLPYNLPPATVFMGDAGSMLLGFFVALMMIMFCQEGTARWFLAACVVFALPILDTGLAVVRRLLSHKSIFAGDRSHLYDQLVDRGMTVKQVVGLFYLLSAVAAILGVGLSLWLRLRQALPVYLALLAGVVLVFLLLGMFRPAKTANSKPEPRRAKQTTK